MVFDGFEEGLVMWVFGDFVDMFIGKECMLYFGELVVFYMMEGFFVVIFIIEFILVVSVFVV